MPSSLTSSFASAAAGGNMENGVNRRDGPGGNEWSRNRPNGATQTFRRTSQATTQSRESSQPAPVPSSTGPYIPPHLNQAGATRNGSTADARYNKDQMLSIYRSQKENGTLNRNIEHLFQGPWDYALRNGVSQGRDTKEQPGPEVCWNSSNDGDPFGLVDMSDAEKQMFTSSVNSPIKMTQNKESGPNAGNTRKPSISNHHNASYNAQSAIGSRPGVRRRETSDSFTANGPLSPVEGKSFFRNEPNTNTPPALLRRRTDYLEDDGKAENTESEARGEGDPDTQTPFSSLRRLGTGPLSAGLNGPSASPWSASAGGGPRSAFESMGNFGSFAVAGSPAGQDADKRAGFGSARGTSRFKDLLTKTSTEDMSPSVKEKASFGALGKLPEEDTDPGHSRLKDVFKTRPNRSETNPYDEGIARTGSAALSQDDQGIEQMGFSSFGAPPGQADVHGTPLGRRTNDPISPANTNPYQSPAGGRIEDDEGHEHSAQLPGHQPFAGGRRDHFSGTHDRNQPTFGAPRAGLGSLSGIPGWGPSTFGSGTPGRNPNPVSSAFGDSIFSPMSDLQSPGGAGLGGGFFGAGPIGSAGRPSRLGALFPPAMQEQMRADSRNDAFDVPGESRDPFDGSRRQDTIRNLFEDGRPREGNFSPQPGAVSQTPVGPPGAGQRDSVGPEQSAGHALRNSSGSSTNTLPAAQQRQMVMPDRMRWIYRDPQGTVQGPWSGLEMHDWFKAGFFTAELQVKKLEDTEYEPLAQLVRRIGNSREPFLVPQIGVPHGPPAANAGNQWANTMGNNGGTQPPFANSFPSFGTTLTAEQQNALERRKQEEQYLMARQKEHLAQQQMYLKQMQMQNGPSGMHALQHHSSAHSLHSQPSFGSIASPSGYQPSSSIPAPIQPPQQMHGFGPAPGSASQQPGREDDLPGMMDRMSFNQRTGVPYGASPIGTQPPSMGQGQASFQERVRTGGDGRQAETRAHEEAFLGQDGRNERLEEFNDLRDQFDIEHGQIGEHSLPQPIGAQRSSEEPITSKITASAVLHDSPARSTATEAEELSLTQQVQRTAAAYEKAAAADEQIVQPPPVSISPLPAPAAQRNRQHVADALAAESRSATQTPIETPTSSSIAPWADKTVDIPRGPSLKEIQEAEAKRAAEQEELLAAARRAQAEQERLAAVAAPAPAPGLPSTSTWASSVSPASPGPASSVWSKQGAKPSATATAAPKKTLAQIQKEEEARKQRAVAQAAAQAQAAAAYSNQAAAVAGKRYAELASKVAPVTTPATGGAWTTVGTGGGKAKTPATVIASPTSTPRNVSTSSVPTTAAASVKRPALQTSRTTSISSQSKANEEFSKWVKAQLGNGLNSGINVDNFVQNLMMLPPEIEIIRDSVYASSQTIHGGRFAEEFVRRRKLADKGIVEPASDAGSPGPANDTKAGTGGWSEVAKKGPATAANKEESSNAAFKVVSKKKGRK